MAICFKCGAIMHDDEALKHVCNEADIPKKNETFRAYTIKEVKV